MGKWQTPIIISDVFKKEGEEFFCSGRQCASYLPLRFFSMSVAILEN